MFIRPLSIISMHHAHSNPATSVSFCWIFHIFLHLSSSILFLPALTTGLEGAQLLEDDTDEHLSLPHFLSPETFDIFRHLVAAHCDEDCSS